MTIPAAIAIACIIAGLIAIAVTGVILWFRWVMDKDLPHVKMFTPPPWPPVEK